MTSADSSGPPSGRDHAVVIGASIAGLLAARALSDTFARVTLIERDVVPDQATPRPGVPQSAQAHTLLARGADVLEELFPGFGDELIAAGAGVGDLQGDFRWYLDGYSMSPAVSGLTGYALSRPLIEHLIRTRVMARAGLELIDSTDVLGLIADDGGRVTGVRLSRAALAPEAAPEDHATEDPVTEDPATENPATENPAEWSLAADLVVNAAGRASRAPVWLDALGYPRPTRSRVRPDAVFVTRHYRREPQDLDGRLGAIVMPSPGEPRAGLVLQQEGDRFAVRLAGLLGEDPPIDDDGLLAFAQSLCGPEIGEVMRTATALDEPVKMRYTASVRHHYEKLDRQLDGFLVVGDALCSFNPIYGQGLTVAALEAQVLHRLLAEDDGTTDLPRRFFREVAKVVDTPWGLASAADLRFPEVAGKRRPMHALLNGYRQRYGAAASVDPGLGTTLLRVVNLVEPAKRLQRLGSAFRVFRAARSARSARKSVVEPPANGLDDLFVDLPDGLFGDFPDAIPDPSPDASPDPSPGTSARDSRARPDHPVGSEM